jgi:hypothetical protein
MIGTNAEQPKHGESDGATEGEEGRKRRTRVVAPLSSSTLSIRLCPLRSRAPVCPAQATHSTTVVVACRPPARHCCEQRHVACRTRPCARTIPVPPSLSAVRPAFLACNSSPENASAHTRPISQTTPSCSSACGLSGSSTRRGLWPLRCVPLPISTRTPERPLVQTSSDLLSAVQIRLCRATGSICNPWPPDRVASPARTPSSTRAMPTNPPAGMSYASMTSPIYVTSAICLFSALSYPFTSLLRSHRPRPGHGRLRLCSAQPRSYMRMIRERMLRGESLDVNAWSTAVVATRKRRDSSR